MTSLNALLVGCGGMGNNWAGILDPRTDINIVGLVDVVPAASGALASQNGMDVPRFSSLDDALRSIDVEVVLDTSIPETRRQIAGEAMEAGCHVLSEKPLATSVEEALELLAISARTGKTHAVMQNRRYLAGTQGMRQLVADGVIGEVGMVCADFFLGAHFGGFRDEMANILLLDMAIHTFDQARFMTGS
ncbi:MAG: Gfo/Idh/MocA family oxidoreductase, partial [Gammaproteobacteria bacterium]|nr:Gfo/Idh/MocA family oxidoreductase [Gammaproteobacteria bacterium]